MSHIRTLEHEDIIIHDDTSTGVSSKPVQSSLEASNDDSDRVEVDLDELRAELGLNEIVSSVEAMKSLLNQVVGKRKAQDEGLMSSKQARIEEVSVPRGEKNSTEFDPSSILELNTAQTEADEFNLPAVFDESDVCGPKISEHLATRVNEACTKKAIESKLKDLEGKYHTPENCSNLCVPKVNPELWFDLPRASKTKDLALQEVQRGIVKATQPILGLLDNTLAAQKNKEKIEPISILSQLADSVTFLCHSSYKVSMTRREILKDAINTNYRSVCGQNTPLGKCLIGDELPKHIKDIAEVNNLSKKIHTSSQQSSSSSSGRRDREPYSRGYASSRGKKPYFLNYGGRNRSRYRKEGSQTPKSSTTTK